MNLKVKIAYMLRKWADGLNPVFPYNQNISSPYFTPEKREIKRLMVKRTIPRYAYEHFPDRFNQLVRKDLTVDMAKELEAQHLIKIMIEPGVEQVDYIGEIKVVCPYD